MQTLKPKVIRVVEEKQERKNEENIEITQVGTDQFRIVRTMTEYVNGETVKSFNDEIAKALAETQKNLDAIPSQVLDRQKALGQQKEVLEKRMNAFKAVVDAMPKPAPKEPATPNEPSEIAK